jgi:predicted methyltransferase
VEPTAFFKFEHFVKAVAELQGYAVTHPNLTVTTAAALEGLKFPEKLDLFWISRNYHDLHDEFMGPVDIAAFNKAVYNALKPGGVYVILDHSAALGAPANVTETLHRIESSTVRREVEAAGFKFDSESSTLANPADPRTAKVFDATIRGRRIEAFLEQGISAYAEFRRCVRSCFDRVDAWPTQHSRVAISSKISLNSFAAADREAVQ